MALKIKDPETELLAARAAALTGDSTTGAVRRALRELLSRHQPGDQAECRRAQLMQVLEEEVWPLLPPEQLGRPISKAEREELLGFEPDGA